MRSGYSGYSGTTKEIKVETPKPQKKRKKRGYYDEKEEEGVLLFLTSTNVAEREKIYNEVLRKPIDKMIESIIRTYRLYRVGFSFSDLHTDALSFLITKFDKFDPEMGKKSYSYFGTICRNYLYGEMIKSYKKSTKTLNYDDVVDDLIERPDMMQNVEQEDIDMAIFMNKLIGEIQVELEDPKTSENETKVGLSLIEILSNWNTLFEDFVGTPKFNKNLILLYLREMTGLTTKEIRNAMRRFKSLYYIFKDKYIS